MTLRHKNAGEWAKKVLSRGQHDLETRQAISEQFEHFMIFTAKFFEMRAATAPMIATVPKALKI